jgi:hypothetical protein
VVSEEIRDTAEAVKGIVEAVPVYQDVLQPAAKELGIALQTLAKTVHIALAPVGALVWGFDKIKEFVSTRVAEKLKGVPIENIGTPKANIAGPALEALRYTGHEEALREMYANLLATSMDKTRARKAHPAFVEIIRQLTPDEAKIVQLFARPKPLPLLDLRVDVLQPTDSLRGGNELHRNFSLLGEEAGCTLPEMTPTYLDNICRLGLAEIPQFFEYTAPGTYEPLEQHPTIQSSKKAYESSGKFRVTLIRKALRITQLGLDFCEVCVDPSAQAVSKK